MVGTIHGLSLSQRVKLTGKPEAGWRLYLYEAGTNIRANAYKDTGLTTGQEHPWPIVADAYGTMPDFWLADGSYRVRGTSSTGGVTFFDRPSVLALGASDGSSGGGGDTTDPNAIFQTGDVMWLDVSGTRSGWVRDNGRTIGSATSGASERANADCENLFAFLWNTYSNTLCPVSTGRGASAAADWAANKTITLLDKRGRAPFGLDDMGNSAASRFTGVTFTTGDATTAGSLGGENTHTLTSNEMPAHTHTASVTDPGHTHTYGAPLNTAVSPGGVSAGGLLGSGNTTGSGTTGITVDNSNTGGGVAHNNMPLFVVGSWYRKL